MKIAIAVTATLVGISIGVAITMSALFYVLDPKRSTVMYYQIIGEEENA